MFYYWPAVAAEVAMSDEWDGYKVTPITHPEHAVTYASFNTAMVRAAEQVRECLLQRQNERLPNFLPRDMGHYQQTINLPEKTSWVHLYVDISGISFENQLLDDRAGRLVSTDADGNTTIDPLASARTG